MDLLTAQRPDVLGELHLKACFKYERMERNQLFLLYLLVY